MNRRRYVVAALVFFFLSFAALEVAGNIDLLLTGATQDLIYHPVTLLLETSGRGKLLWLLLSAFGLLGVLWALFGNTSIHTHPDMYTVVPGFKIPRPSGHGEYGTAWWMEPKEFDRYFASVSIPRNLPLSADLKQRYEEERRAVNAKRK